jgi:hypothetical protein
MNATIAVLLLAGAVCGMAGVYASPLGIPPAGQGVVIVLGLILNLAGLRVLLKAKKSGRLPTASRPALRKRFILTILLCAVMTVLTPFLLPMKELHLSSGQMVFVCVTTFAVSCVAVWLGFKLAASKANNPPPLPGSNV